MKKIISALVIGFLFTACELNGGEETSSLEILPVNSVAMPTAFARDSITEIPVRYIRPTTCHFFNDFYYYKYALDRTVAIYNIRLNQSGCQNDGVTLVEVPLKFKPAEIGTYHFKFWTGDDSQGVSQYEEYDVVVDH